MKNKIFLYLFLFAVLFIIFQYMNEKSIFESQENKIASLIQKVSTASDSISGLNEKVSDLNYFTLQGNENAITYFERLGLDALGVETMVSEVIYDKNLLKGGNPLIPLAGTKGEMRINKLKFLNHRWVLADFSDGTNWGEIVIEYFFDENKELELSTIGAVLYPN